MYKTSILFSIGYDYIFLCQRDNSSWICGAETTVNALYYKTVLQKVKKAVKKKRGSDHHWFLHHDNAPSYCSLIVQQYLTKKAVTAIPHSLYSPDVSPCEFFLFPQFKRTMKGKWFQTIEEIWLAIERQLREITPVNFQCCNIQWVEHWRCCVNAGGEYFEGDH